ncbi:aminoglycoside phosphotransferase family protein [Dactylosporangium sp. NPDC051541]|uniref:aminoglycoside phosphotransferase family protein n=1 Tax=Dactylosporangium sp. NPDC051541 TaxID=3363977 RepID=UPI00379A10B5
MSLPVRTAVLVLVDGDGAVLGELPPFDARIPFWPETEDLVDGARAFGAEISVLRFLGADGPGPVGGVVTYLAQLEHGAPELAPTSFRLEPHPLRAPYAEVGGPAASLAWARDELVRAGYSTPAKAVQRKTWNLSGLWRLETDRGTVWLKHLPPFLKAESEVLAWLNSVAPGSAPPLISADGNGRQLIGHLPGEDGFGAPAAARYGMADLLHGLQRRAVEDVDALAARGVRDRRGPLLADQMVAAALPWLEEIPGLEALLDSLPERFAELAACGLPDTLVHADFHPGNVRFSASVPPAALDWGDSFLGHPGFDVLSLSGGLAPPDEVALVEHWAALWRQVVPGSDPVRAVDLLRPLSPLYGALIYSTFVENIEPSEWPYHAEDVPRCLKLAVDQG